MQTYDAIVIGAGAMGSAAAYYLAKAGQKVLLLEQFEIDHKNGSSYGHSRIIRYAYNEPLYIELAKATYPLWFALEEESGEKLFQKTGGIDFGRLHTEETLRDTLESVKRADIPHEVLTPLEGMARFPQFRFDDGMTVLYQPDTGMLFASKCVTTHIAMAKKYGATVLDQTPVTGITVLGDSVEVNTDQAVYSAARLVVTAGAWAKHLLMPLGVQIPVHIQRCQPAFFEPVGVDRAEYGIGKMPVYIFHRGGDIHHAMYGLPDHDGVGVKSAFHGGDILETPAEVNYTPDDDTIENIRQLTRKYIPAIGDGPMLSTRICLYTVTSDEDFIVDHHPEHKHVLIGGGFSGHGFKFSTTIGQILSQLALEGKTEHNTSLFRILRFRLETE